MRLHSLHQKARLSAASAIDQLRSLLAKSAAGSVTQQLDLSELEDRILLSASPVAVMVESAPAAESVNIASPLAEESPSLFAPPQTAIGESPDSTSVDSLDQAGQTSGDIVSQPTSLAELDETAGSILSESTAEQTATEVIFIDEAAEDFEQLIADLESQRDAGRAIDFFVLDSQQDGIDQIAETLQRYSNLDAVHIVSHGTSGAVKLGATWLRIGSLDAYAGTIAGWGSAIGTDGDLLFYGCDLASSSRGEMLVESISALTGADVAASTDDTGHVIYGGDWDLEYSVGSIETDVAFSFDLQLSWSHVMALETVRDEFNAGNYSGNDGSTGWTGNWLETGEGDGPSSGKIQVVGNRLRVWGKSVGGEALTREADLSGATTATLTYEYQRDVVENEGSVTVSVWEGASWTNLITYALSTDDASPVPESFDITPYIAADTRIRFLSNGGEDSQFIYFDNIQIEYETIPAQLASSSEFLVNVTTTDFQETSAEDRGSQQAVSLAADGSYVVVWSSVNQDGSGWGVYARRFDSAGAALTGEVQVAQTTADNQQWARVASDDVGNFVVTWTSTNQDSTPQSVYARRFDSAGTALANEFRVNTTSSGTQKDSSIAMDSAGNFVIAWQGNASGDADGIFYRRFNADETAIDATDVLANGTNLGAKVDPDVAINDAGQFAVSWANVTNVYVRHFDASGVPTHVDLQVDNNLSASYAPAIGIDSTGRTIVVYRTDGLSGIEAGVWGRGFDHDGTQRLTYFEPSDAGFSSDNTSPSIAMDNAGNFVVTYHGNDNGDGDGDSVKVRRYTADGVSLGPASQVNVSTTGNQNQASVALLDVNNFVVVWSGEGDQAGEVDTSGVFARQFHVIAPVLDLDADNSSGASGSDFSANFVDGGGPVAVVDTDATLSDANDTDLKSLKVTITDLQDGASEVLAADTSGTSIVASFSAGVLTLSGTDTAANYQNVLRSVTYDNGQDPATGTSRTITFVANDGVTNSNLGTTSLSINNQFAAVLSADGDTYIDKGANGTNYGNSASLVIDKSGGDIGDQRALLQFDLASIPAGATITGATLKLEATQNAGPYDVNIYEVTESWVEGNGGTGAASWKDREPGTAWSAGDGATYDPAILATLNTGALGQHTWDLTSLVQAWYTGSSVNNGIIIGSPIGGGGTVTYDSSEGTTPPELEILYTAPTNAAPTITSAPIVNVTENSTAVTTVTATDADLPAETLSYSITGSADSGKFSINGTTGDLTFAVAPDFEFPGDANQDNVYEVSVQVSDGGGGLDTQSIDVTVTNNADSTTIYLKSDTSPPFSDLSTTAPVATNLGNYDPGRDSVAGLFIGKGGAGANETDDVLHHTWTISGAVNIASQPVQLIFWSDVKDGMNAGQTADVAVGKNATVTAYLMDLATGTTESGGTVIATGSVSDSSWGDGFAWEQKTIDFCTVNHSVATGRHLAVKLIVDGSSGDDLWFAYDTTSFDSRLEIGGNNTAPVISSNGGGAAAAVNVAENSTVVTTVTATDSDLPAQTLSYSITGGVDAAHFSINTSSGELMFVSPPNFETPTDLGANNVYDVTVDVSDGNGGSDSQVIAVTVTAVNDNTPTITSDGGGASAALNVAENATAVTTVTATDADLPGDTLTYSISGGADAVKFSINSSTGALTFALAPDFETPTDVGTDNVYEAEVTADDGNGGIDVQQISATVTDLNDEVPAIDLSITHKLGHSNLRLGG